MEQKLLTEIELDVEELKCLMKSYSQEPTSALIELLKRNVLQMQGHLNLFLRGLESAQVSPLFPSLGEGSVKAECQEAESVIQEERREESSVEKDLVADNFPIETNGVDEGSEMEGNEVEEEEATGGNPVAEMMEETEETEAEKEEERNQEEENENMMTTGSDFSSKVLGESLSVYTGGLRRFISLNDSFRFSRELFGGDSELMNRVMEQVSAMSSCWAAIAFVSSKVRVDDDNETFNDFLELIKRYFNQQRQ